MIVVSVVTQWVESLSFSSSAELHTLTCHSHFLVVLHRIPLFHKLECGHSNSNRILTEFDINDHIPTVATLCSARIMSSGMVNFKALISRLLLYTCPRQTIKLHIDAKVDIWIVNGEMAWWVKCFCASISTQVLSPAPM